jgi:hypothetical protein
VGRCAPQMCRRRCGARPSADRRPKARASRARLAGWAATAGRRPLNRNTRRTDQTDAPVRLGGWASKGRHVIAARRPIRPAIAIPIAGFAAENALRSLLKQAKYREAELERTQVVRPETRKWQHRQRDAAMTPGDPGLGNATRSAAISARSAGARRPLVAAISCGPGAPAPQFVAAAGQTCTAAAGPPGL